MPEIDFARAKGRTPPPTPAPRLSEHDRERAEKERVARERELLEAERIYRAGTVTVRDLIAPAAMKIEADYLRLGSMYARTLFLVSYPRYISVGWFAPIINFNIPLDISMFFYSIDSAIILKQLRNKVGVLEAQIISDAEKARRAIRCARRPCGISRNCATI